MIAVGPAVPISRRSQMGVPVGVRANLALALAQGATTSSTASSPACPSLSYLALRDTDALTVATFCSTDRLSLPARALAAREAARPARRAARALASRVRDAAAERFPGDYRLVSPGVDPEPLRAGAEAAADRRRAAPERARRRAQRRCARCASCPGWEAVLLRTKPLVARPAIPRDLAGRVRVRTARDGASRAALLNETRDLRARASTGSRACCSRRRPRAARSPRRAASRTSPSSRRAAVARLAEDDALRAPRAGARRAPAAAAQSFADVAAELEALYDAAHAAPPRPRAARPTRSPTAPWIVADLHMHTSWSFDCTVDPAELVDHAEAEGLGAIAITDHNVFGGALETVDLARDRDLVVIPGEEVKTDEQGEVIGLFLEREIPRGMPFADTIAAIREQGGLVYVPHPFDRMHTIPDAATLHRHLADIDVFEVYNARLLFEAHNDEALRFARKYDLTMGAGSDAHVLQGVGTGALRMRAFRDPEEFLISLRRPRSCGGRSRSRTSRA